MSKDINFVMNEQHPGTHQSMNLGNVGQSGTRLSTTQRIISPASSVNHYPHLKGNGNEIISAAGSQRNSVY